MRKLLNDEGFKHIHYNATDLHKTFERVRRELREKAEQDKQLSATVRTLKTAKGTK